MKREEALKKIPMFAELKSSDLKRLAMAGRLAFGRRSRTRPRPRVRARQR